MNFDIQKESIDNSSSLSKIEEWKLPKTQTKSRVEAHDLLEGLIDNLGIDCDEMRFQFFIRDLKFILCKNG